MPVSIQPNNTLGNYEKGVARGSAGGNLALFSCEVTWVVNGTTSGHIIQRIQRNEKYRANVRTEMHDIVATGDYWEAWEIDNKGKAQPWVVFNDNFGVYNNSRVYQKGGGFKECPPKMGTSGRWKIRGTVYYLPAGSFQASGWTPGGQQGGVPMAGRLLTRWDPPSAGRGLQAGVTLGRPVCIRQFAGSWDWSVTGAGNAVSTRRRWPLGGNFDSTENIVS